MLAEQYNSLRNFGINTCGSTSELTCSWGTLELTYSCGTSELIHSCGTSEIIYSYGIDSDGITF